MKKGIVWEGVDGSDMAQKRAKVTPCCEHGNVPSGSIKYPEFLD